MNTTPQNYGKHDWIFDMVLKAIPTVWALIYFGVSLSLYVSDGLPTVAASDNTDVWHGFVHGFYLVPIFVASVVSNEYSIYQTGGDMAYNIAYMVGIYWMYRCFLYYKNMRKLSYTM